MDPLRQEKLETLLQSTTTWGIGIVIAILLLAGGVYLLRAWYRDRDDTADHSDEILEQMRELRAEGDLSDEEFRSIKGRLTNSPD